MNKQSLINFLNSRTDWFSAFTNGKNLRVAVILIGIYHMVEDDEGLMYSSELINFSKT